MISDLRPADVAAVAQRFESRPIPKVGPTYLTRYFVAKSRFGDVFLHHFHRSDADVPHSHPWPGASLILTGGYKEQRRKGFWRPYVAERIYRPGDVSFLLPWTFHRVELLNPGDGCWTLFVCGPHWWDWGFWHPETDVFTQWEKFVAARDEVEERRAA